MPANVSRYRVITRNDCKTEQVLVSWKGLPSQERTWEDLRWVTHLNPNSNLEDKVRRAGEGDVAVTIDQTETEDVLKRVLGISLPDGTEPVDSPEEPGLDRPTCARRSTRHAEFEYS